MQPVDTYLAAAKTAKLDEFISRNPRFFLVKRPRKRGNTPSTPATISYDTVLAQVDVDPFAGEWRLVPVQKRADNPFPERITVGRATNCDVVLRLPSISKLHALLIVGNDGSLSLRDNQAVNETFVNGRKLASNAQVLLNIGDIISFGRLDLEFVDAATLFKMLRGEMSHPI